MSTTEYELWDVKTANMLFYTADVSEMVEMLRILFDENRLSPHLDDLSLGVYNAEEEGKTFNGAEAIEKWLSFYDPI